MRDLVGPVLELLVGPARTCGFNGNGRGRAAHHLREALGDGACERFGRELHDRCARGSGDVDAPGRAHGRLPLLGREDGQARDGPCRILDHRLEQRAVVPGHALDGRTLEEVGVVDEAEREGAVRLLGGGDREVELGLHALGCERLRREVGQRDGGPLPVREHVEHDLEERRAAGVARGGSCARPASRRACPGGRRRRADVAHAGEQLAEGWARRRGRSRSTRVLTKKPMRPSISARLRPAMGEPTTMSSCAA